MLFPFGLWTMVSLSEFKRGFNCKIYPILNRCENRAVASLWPRNSKKTDESGVQVVSIMRSDTVSYGLNCVPPKFICLSPNPQCDGIRRWIFGRSLGLDEFMKMESSQ